MSRLDAIKGAQAEKETGGYGVPRKWYTNKELLKKQGIKEFKTKVSTNFLRLCPPENPDVYFGLRIFVHYNMGPNGSDAFLCPAMMKGELLKIGRNDLADKLPAICPICKRREVLVAAEADKDVTKAFSCFPPRYLYIVFNVETEETEKEGAQLYDAPQKINNEILGLSQNRRTGEVIDISDIDNGKVLVFDRTGTGALTTSYGAFELDKGEPIPDKWLDGVLPIEEFLHFASEKELQESLGTSAPEEPASEIKAVTSEEPRQRRSRRPLSEPVVEKKEEPKAATIAEGEHVRRRQRISRDEQPEETSSEAPKAEAGEDTSADDVKARLKERLAKRRQEA